MKKTILIFSALSAIAISAIAADGTAPNADNTAKNDRDRSGATTTADDQSNSRSDLKLTQAIRKAIMKDDSLSMTAKNVKIIAVKGKVTLRGPVNNAEEKTKIDKLAKQAAGEGKVDNQLEVKKPS